MLRADLERRIAMAETVINFLPLDRRLTFDRRRLLVREHLKKCIAAWKRRLEME